MNQGPEGIHSSGLLKRVFVKQSLDFGEHEE